jgi:hypothetical protein
MKNVLLNIELINSAAFRFLQDSHQGNAWRYIRMVTIAAKANRRGGRGRVQKYDKTPYGATELARTHERSSGYYYVEIWEAFLAECLEHGLLVVDPADGCYVINNWHLWVPGGGR